MDREIRSSSAYHWTTKHERNRIRPHYLDFETYPVPGKTYGFLKKIEFSKEISGPDVDLAALFRHSGPGSDRTPITVTSLCRALFLAYGVTQATHVGSRAYYARTVPSAGGLYPCHLYLVVGKLGELETGVYYCDMIQGGLGLIHKGRVSSAQKDMAAISIIITAKFFSSAWKYRDRAFRYMLLDAGHLAENLSLSIKASGWPCLIEDKFDDQALSEILGLDPSKEVPLVCVNFTQAESKRDGFSGLDIEWTGPRAGETDLCRDPVSYPLLQHAYDMGSAAFHEKTGPVQSAGVTNRASQKNINAKNFKPVEGRMPFVETVLARRSRRNFIVGQLDKERAGALFHLASGFDVFPCLTVGITCQDVQNLEDGFYLFSKETASFQLIQEGRHHRVLSRVCLDQHWMANAAMHFLFMANLADLEQNFGPRGYRTLLMAAGRMAQKIYLAAEGLGLGCCGVGALYDNEAQVLFDLTPESALFYAVSAGRVK